MSETQLPVSELLRTQCERAGLISLAERLAAGAEPSLEDALQASAASLPLIGKLIEIKRTVSGESRASAPGADRCIVLEIDSGLESSDRATAIEAAQAHLRRESESSADAETIFVSVARWPKHLSCAARIELLSEIVSIEVDRRRFIPLGPTTEELYDWLARPGDALTDETTSSVLIRLRDAGVPSIAGSDLGILQQAVECGMSVQVEQNLVAEPALCRLLIAARETLYPSGHFLSWSPRLAESLGAGASPESGASGLEVLRAIALARLILPLDVQIRAPLATMGGKLAHVALDFGATHLGLVPAGGDLADSLFEELRENSEQTLLEPA